MDNEHHKYIPGSGPLGARILLLFEAPSLKDTAAGRILEERNTMEVLRDAGINWHECWKTTVCKYYVPPSPGKRKIPFPVRAKNYGIDMAQQINELQIEINQLQPTLIIAFGSTALWALTGKTDINFYRGSILLGMGVKTIATLRPDHLSWQATDIEFKGYYNRQLMIFDCKRALAQSQFKELRLPSRHCEVAKNSAHLAEFRRAYKDKSILSVDIEALGTCIPVCIGLSFSKYHGMTVPLWNTEDISNIPTSDLVQMWLIVAELLEEKNIVGHNFNYDRDKIKRLGFRVRRLLHDTMMKAHAIQPELPKNLALQISLYTEEPAYKDDGMYHGSVKDLLEGCARDACCTLEVNDAMEPDIDELRVREFYENFLMELPGVYYDIQNQGFRIDTTERDNLLRKYIEWDERLRFELFKIAGTEINVSSPKQVPSLLFDNWKLPRKDSTGEEAITELLNSPKVKNEDHRRGLELILEDRRVRKSVSQYLMSMPDFDNRMKTSYFMCLETGRTSTGQLDPPMRPTVEIIDENGKKKDKVIGLAFQTMTKHGDIGADIRGMYVPDISHIEFIDGFGECEIPEEEEFVQLDAAQAEARVIFKLAQDEQALKDIDTRDYHALTASWFFGGTEDTYSKKKLGYEHPIRFVGKTLRHAGHLGAGKKRAAISVNTDARKFKIPITITEQIAEQALKIFHTKQPKIQQVFQNQVIECLKRTRQLRAPVPYGSGAKYGPPRTFFERWGDELFRQAFSYIPQRTVSDNTKMAAIRIRARIPYVKIVMESHDALLLSIPISKKREWIPICKEEMERPIDFSQCSLPRSELVLPCEVEIGKNYRDLSKFKDKTIPLPATPELNIQRSTTGDFVIVDLPADTKRDNDIYYHTVTKKELRNFEVD